MEEPSGKIPANVTVPSPGRGRRRWRASTHGRRVRAPLEHDGRIGGFGAPHVALGSAVFPAVHVPVEAGAFATEEFLIQSQLKSPVIVHSVPP